MTITPAGRVGIGVSTLTDKLQLFNGNFRMSGTTAPTIIIESSGTNNSNAGEIQFLESGGATGWKIRHNSTNTNDPFEVIRREGSVDTVYANIEKTNGDASFRGKVIAETRNTGVQLGQDGSNSYVNNIGSGNFEVRKNGTTQFTFDQTNARLGIGTTTPSEQIHATGDGRFGNITIGNKANSSTWPGLRNVSRTSGNDYAIIQNSSGNTLVNSVGTDLEFRKSNSTVMKAPPSKPTAGNQVLTANGTSGATYWGTGSTSVGGSNATWNVTNGTKYVITRTALNGGVHCTVWARNTGTKHLQMFSFNSNFYYPGSATGYFSVWGKITVGTKAFNLISTQGSPAYSIALRANVTATIVIGRTCIDNNGNGTANTSFGNTASGTTYGSIGL